MKHRGWIIALKRGLPLLLAGCAGFVSSPAEAQEVPPATSPEDHLNDIVVTARRRPEPLQRTPVSVVALTGRELESRSVTNLRSLQNFVPNLTFAPSQNVGEAAANTFMGSIGQEDFGIGAEAGVAFYIDGVYLPRSLGLLMNLVDIDRIEVLRGPQGTLFGKDAIGGAISLISIMPGPGRERSASAILGNDNQIELRTIVNEPLSDRLFLRLAVGIVSRDGYLRRLDSTSCTLAGPVERANGRPIDLHSEGDDRGQGGRLQLRWLMTDTLTADLALDGSRKRDRQGAIHIDLIDPRFGDLPKINELIPARQAARRRDYRRPGTGQPSRKLRRRQQFHGSGILGGVGRPDQAARRQRAQIYRRLPWIVQPCRDWMCDGLYFDLGGNDLKVKQRQVSGELQFNGVAGRLTYTAGLFAFGERPKLLPWGSMTDVLYTCGCFYTPDNLPTLTADPRQLRVENASGYAPGNVQAERQAQRHARRSLQP